MFPFLSASAKPSINLTLNPEHGPFPWGGKLRNSPIFSACHRPLQMIYHAMQEQRLLSPAQRSSLACPAEPAPCPGCAQCSPSSLCLPERERCNAAQADLPAGHGGISYTRVTRTAAEIKAPALCTGARARAARPEAGRESPLNNSFEEIRLCFCYVF